MSRSESIFARIYRECQRLSADASSEQTRNDAASSRTKSTRSPSTRCNRPPRSRSLRFEPLESRELLSLTQPLTADVAPTWSVAPQTPAAVPSEIVAPLALAPESASTPETPAVPVSISTLEPAATQEAEESATSDASLAREYYNGKYYNSHDLAVVRSAGLDPENVWACEWNDEGRLIGLYRYNYHLTSLDISDCVALEVLSLYDTALAKLNVSGCIALRYLSCWHTDLTELDLSDCVALEELDCGNCDLTSLDVSGCVALQSLECFENPRLKSLDVSDCVALIELDCSDTGLTTLDLSKNVALEQLLCGYNYLTSLDLSQNIALNALCCDNNNLTSLDLSQNTKLYYVATDAISSIRLPTERAEDCYLYIEHKSETKLEKQELYYLNSDGAKVDVEFDGYISEEKWEERYNNYVNLVIPPDTQLPYFIDYYQKVEVPSEDGGVEEEIQLVKTCVIGEAAYNEHDVERLSAFLMQNENGTKVNDEFDKDDPATYGVEWEWKDGEFCLKSVEWSDKKLRGELDLSDCVNLETVDVSKNELTSLNVNGCDALEEIDASENELTDFSPISLESATKIDVSFNKLEYLSVTWLYELKELRCVQNSLKTLNFYSLRSLKTLVCGNNPELTEIGWQTDDSYESLETLECWNTGIKTLDVSAFAKLTYLSCYGDETQSVYVPDVCEAGTVDISKLKIDLTRYKTEIAPEEVEEKEDGAKVYPNEESYYGTVSMRETGVWSDNNNIDRNEHTGEISIFKPQTTTFKARIGGVETDVLLPSYGVVYDGGNHEVVGVVRVYGSFFTLPEILLKQDHFDHWKNSTDGIATLLDPLRFDPVHGKELENYIDLPYKIDEKWIDDSNGLDAYGLTLREEFADSSLFEDRKAALIFPGTDSRPFTQTGGGIADVAIDCDPRGVGYGQYETHKSSFQRWLERNDDKTLPNVYGYSLGAALAQWTISDYRGKLQFVELFNTPGISVEAADKFDSSRVEKLTYRIASGDPVSMSGETVLPGGDVLIYSYSSSTELGAWIGAKHLSPLSVPYSFAGNALADERTLMFKAPTSSDVAKISSDVYRSFWFHYDDADYATWRTHPFLSALAPDVLAVRGTTEQGRAKLTSVIKPLSQSATLAALGVVLQTPVFSVGATVALGNSVANLYDLRQYRMEFGNGWKLEQINEDLTCVGGKLSEGTVQVTTPNGWEFDGTLNYGMEGDKKYGLESLTVEIDAEKRLGRDSSYYLSNAALKINKIPELYQTEIDYELNGDGKISYQYRPKIGKEQELASIEGDIKIGANGTTVSNAILGVGDASGQFFALGQTNEFKIVSKIGEDANVPFGGAYGNFDEITLSTDYGVREQNVNYFKLQDATVVWDKQGNVIGFHECVTITGILTVGKRTLSVEARYFGAGSGDWRVTIDDEGKKTVLTPNNPNFEYVPPFVLADLGEISATSAASKVAEKTRVNVGNGGNDATSLARLDVADAPTAVLRCEWTNDCDAPWLRFESPSGVAYSETEMLELGYLQRISAGDESVARSYLTFLSADEFGEWRVTSAASLTDGTATLCETTATSRKPEAKAVDATFDEESGAVAVVVELEKTDVDLTAETLEILWLSDLAGGEKATVATTNVALEDAEIDELGRLTFVLNVAELGLPNGDYRLVARVDSTFATVASQAFAFEPVARLEASETTLNFGAVDLDAANDDGENEDDENAGVVERTITLKNAGSKTATFALKPTGNAGTTDFYVAGLYADGESVDSGNVALRPGESVELTFYFAPTAVVGREIAVEMIETETSDVLSTLRLNGLGVSQNVPTAAITSDVVRVQEGCAVWLSGAASIAPNGGALEYRWGLDGSSATSGGALTDGDGGFYRVVETSSSFDVRLQVVDENGVALREIAVETVAPTINVKTTTREVGDANVLTRFDLAVDFFSERTVERWTLNWGDGTETVLDERSSAATFAHCYKRGDEAKNYVATLKLTASDVEVYEFALGETFVPADEELDETPSLIVTTGNDVVDATDGEISLREAILYAEADATLGNAITFAPSLQGATITLTSGQLEISQGLKIDASALYNASTGTPGITVDANQKSRVFYLNGGTEANPVELIGLTLTGAKTNSNRGGGVYVSSGTTLFTNCAITDNTAGASGGGVYVYSGAATFANCIISGNGLIYSGQGGGVYVWSGATTFRDCAITENEATYQGGGVFVSSGTTEFIRCEISGNIAGVEGGAFIDAETSSFVDCVIADNAAESCGGLSVAGTSTFINCAITGNTATKGGVGGVSVAGAATFANCAITDNKAATFAGGVSLAGTLPIAGVFPYSEPTTFTNCVIAGNSAEKAGGVFIYNGGVFDARNSIVVLNAAKKNADFDVVNIENIKISADYAMFGATDLVAGTNNYIYNSSLPLFKDAANGDYTLATNSQALDKGNDAYVAGYLTDLAGKPRVSGSCVDLGAYEYERRAETPSTVVTTSRDVADVYDGEISLREAILYAEADATLGDAITFAPSLQGATITLTSGQLEISQGLKIDASALYNVSTQTSGITVDANKLSRVFYLNGGDAEKPIELLGLTITGGKTSGEEASGYTDGGVYVKSGVAAFTNCAITGNTTAKSGGGLYVDESGAATLTDSTASGNTAQSGGGLCIVGSGTIENSTIVKNTATYGGVYVNGTLTATGATISNNEGNYGAGGYVNNEATATFTDYTLGGNASTKSGGAAYVDNDAWATFTDCMLGGNASTSNGGGIQINGTATIENSTISDNVAADDGGGMRIGSNGTATLTNSTVSGNTAGTGGGVSVSGTATLRNSIVALNVADDATDVYDYYGRNVSAFNVLSSYSAWSNANESGVVNYVYDKSQPLFDAAKGDYTLAANSQALDKGKNEYAVDADGKTLISDLAGNARITGAYERDSYPVAAALKSENEEIATGCEATSIWTAFDSASRGGYRLSLPDAISTTERRDAAFAAFEAFASTSVLDDVEFATDRGADVWSEIEAALVGDEATRKSKRRDPFEALAEEGAFDVWGDADGFGDWRGTAFGY